jgi:DNA-binding transcriptional LysR family regulator
MSLDANDLILFAQVMEAGSFSRAAERMDLPKSTVSRRITQLETALGERLLMRTTRRLTITDFGERILDHARRLLEETEAASALAQHRQATPRGVLRASLLPDFVELDLTSLCLQYAARYPEVRLELDLSPRRVDLLVERYDLAVRAASRLPDDNTLVARKLHEMRLGLYASPAYLARYGEPETPEDLKKHVCLSLIGGNGETKRPPGACRAERIDGRDCPTAPWRSIPRSCSATSPHTAWASSACRSAMQRRRSRKACSGASCPTGSRPP